VGAIPVTFPYGAGWIATVEKTGRLLVVVEQVHPGGWGATVVSELTMRGVPIARPEALGPLVG